MEEYIGYRCFYCRGEVEELVKPPIRYGEDCRRGGKWYCHKCNKTLVGENVFFNERQYQRTLEKIENEKRKMTDVGYRHFVEQQRKWEYEKNHPEERQERDIKEYQHKQERNKYYREIQEKYAIEHSNSELFNKFFGGKK